ncbi:MAG: aspartate kinase [Candidatus Levybacteria bacterium]|nr:aspartate kinase [Candidatus Levybacteria bacterium]
MLSVSEAVETIVKRSRYLSEAMAKGIINTSALARYTKPELEEMLGKEISDAAAIMAVTRVSGKIHPPYKFKNIFHTAPDMVFRSNLVEITCINGVDIDNSLAAVLKISDKQSSSFLAVTKGVFDTTLIVSQDIFPLIKKQLADETITAEYTNLAAITIRLPQEAIKTPGIFYFFLKSLAWEGVNIVEIVSAHLELTIIFEQHEAQKAFVILQSLFSKENRQTI